MDKVEAKQRYELANTLYGNGKFAEALDLLSGIAEACPNQPDVVYAQALCLKRLGRIGEARKLAEKLEVIFNDTRGTQLGAELGSDTREESRTKGGKASGGRWRLVLGLAVLVLFLWAGIQTAIVLTSSGPRLQDLTKERTVTFPDGRVFGTLYIRPFIPDRNWGLDSEQWQFFGEARGVVRVQANSELRLDVADSTPFDLSPLDLQSPNAFQEICFSETSVADADLVHLAGLTELRSLLFDSTRIGDQGMPALLPLQELRRLRFHSTTDSQDKGLPRIGDAGLVYIAQLTELQGLDLDTMSVTDAGLVHLTQLPELVHLSLDFVTQITDSGIAQLARMPALQQVYIGSTQITDQGIDLLAGLPLLRKLSVDRTRITDRSLLTLGALPTLSHLYLSNNPLSDAGLVHLGGLSLEMLKLYNISGITDASVPVLQSMKTLKELALTGTSITPSGYWQIQDALPECQIAVPEHYDTISP